MNFLAHAYLSFENEEILVGNMIGDFVKGKQKDLYPTGIKNGIELHRFIDFYTDTNSIVHEAEKILKPFAGRYSGVFMDIVFDYFIANDLNEKTENEWKQFAQNTYQILEKYQSCFPEKFKDVFYYMKKYDWLYNYRFDWEIQNSFNSIVRRAKYLTTNGSLIFTAFQENKESLKRYYEAFFPEIKTAVRRQITSFINE